MASREGQLQDMQTEQAPEPPAPAVEYSVSGCLAATLSRLNISIAFTSYQSGVLYCIGRNPNGGIHVHQAGLPHPMGLSFDNGCLTRTGGYQVLRFENVLEPNQ
ncbi:MAG: hypothetical protein ACI9NT_000123 [Bacteroidia bacterium]